MIPDLINIKNAPWAVLPPGIHVANIHEIKERYAFNPHRLKLYSGFLKGMSALNHAGCTRVFLDGSYVTAKPFPSDFDACWEERDVDLSKLDPVLKDFSNFRKAQKLKYGGEFFPAGSITPTKNGSFLTFLDFFQIEKNTGLPKGILQIDIS